LRLEGARVVVSGLGD
jgi:NAD(P)-dependent dehydrogenase (short-subunit alcohol dehydrogenase family)